MSMDNNTSWVIMVLDDSLQKSIEYSNRLWLRKNVKRLNIIVCVEDCVIMPSDLPSLFKKRLYIVQNGKHISKKEFDKDKEAIMLYKVNEWYYAFVYSLTE